MFPFQNYTRIGNFPFAPLLAGYQAIGQNERAACPISRLRFSATLRNIYNNLLLNMSERANIL
jgi:hypothetical protein